MVTKTRCEHQLNKCLKQFRFPVTFHIAERVLSYTSKCNHHVINVPDEPDPVPGTDDLDLAQLGHVVLQLILHGSCSIRFLLYSFVNLQFKKISNKYVYEQRISVPNIKYFKGSVGDLYSVKNVNNLENNIWRFPPFLLSSLFPPLYPSFFPFFSNFTFSNFRREMGQCSLFQS